MLISYTVVYIHAQCVVIRYAYVLPGVSNHIDRARVAGALGRARVDLISSDMDEVHA